MRHARPAWPVPSRGRCGTSCCAHPGWSCARRRRRPAELVDVAYRGVHPPEQMPFMVPWTDADPRYLGRGIAAALLVAARAARPATMGGALPRPPRRPGDRHAGPRASTSRSPARSRTGSWLGLRHQGHGFGTEMRAAVLLFAFDHLGATRARSDAFADNVASLRVSERLGYRRDGSARLARRGAPAEDLRLVLDPADFVRPEWTLAVDGVDGCRGLLGRRLTSRRSAQVDAAGEGVAPGRVAGLVAGRVPLLALRRAAVGELALVHPPAAELRWMKSSPMRAAVSSAAVTSSWCHLDDQRPAGRGRHGGRVVGPHAGVAVGLQLQAHRAGRRPGVAAAARASIVPSRSWMWWPYSCAITYARANGPPCAPNRDSSSWKKLRSM